MGRFEEKIDEIKERGDIQRGRWRPTPGSWHYEWYRRWKRESGNSISTENFCHYWRVVMIWMPLRWLVFPALFMVLAAVFVAVVFLIVQYPKIVLSIPAIFIGAVIVASYLVGSIRFFMHVFSTSDEDLFCKQWGWIERLPVATKFVVMVLSLPILFVATAFSMTVSSIVDGVEYLEDEHYFFTRLRDWFFYGSLGEGGLLEITRPWMVLPVAIVVASFWYYWALVITLTMIGIVVLVGLVALGMLTDEVIHKAAKDRKIQRKANSPVTSTATDDDEAEEGSGWIVELFALIWAYLVAKEKRICPLIDLPSEKTR